MWRKDATSQPKQTSERRPTQAIIYIPTRSVRLYLSAGSHLRACRRAAEDCGAFGCGGSLVWIGCCFGNAFGFGVGEAVEGFGNAVGVGEAIEGFGNAFGVGGAVEGLGNAVGIGNVFGNADCDPATAECNTDPRGASALFARSGIIGCGLGAGAGGVS